MDLLHRFPPYGVGICVQAACKAVGRTVPHFYVELCAMLLRHDQRAVRQMEGRSDINTRRCVIARTREILRPALDGVRVADKVDLCGGGMRNSIICAGYEIVRVSFAFSPYVPVGGDVELSPVRPLPPEHLPFGKRHGRRAEDGQRKQTGNQDSMSDVFCHWHCFVPFFN